MTIAMPDLTRILCGDAESGRAPVVVVSGASAGLGQFVPVALARRGCRVARLARSRTELVQSAVADVSDQKAVTRAFQRISVGLGPVRILVAGAAIYPRHEVLAQPDAPVQEVPAVNLGGRVNCAMAALAQMVPMGKGRILLVGNSAGDASLPGSPGYSVYRAGGRALVAETSARLPGLAVSERVSPVLAPRMGRADGVAAENAAEGCAGLATNCDHALRGMVFTGSVEHRTRLGLRQRLTNRLTLRRPEPLGRMDGGGT